MRQLAAAEAQVTCLVLDEAERRELPARVTSYVADLRDASAVRAVAEAACPAFVFHLAAAGVTEYGIDAVTAVRINVEGTLNLLTALKGTGYCRFLFVGTCHEYGDNRPPFREKQSPAPANVYAASKLAAWVFCQMYHRAHGWPVVGVRPFGVYGPGQRPPAFLPALIRAALCGQDFSMTGGEQVRDFVYVEDVIEGMIRAVTVPGIEGQVFNLCAGEGVYLVELAHRAVALVGDPIRINVGALSYRPGEIWRMVGDNARARQVLDWQPTVSLDEGLRRTIAWWRERLRAGEINT